MLEGMGDGSSPTGSGGGALVGSLGDFVPQKPAGLYHNESIIFTHFAAYSVYLIHRPKYRRAYISHENCTSSTWTLDTFTIKPCTAK